MPIGHRWRPAYLCAFFILLIVVFVFSFDTPRTAVSGSVAQWQTQMRELDQDLRNPHLLFLRGGSFDPLEGEHPTVRVGQTQLETTNLVARSARLATMSTAQSSSEKAYFIVQYEDRILPEWTESLRTGGYEIVGYLANNAYIVRAPRAGADELQAAGGGHIRWVGAYGAGLKIDPSLTQAADEIANGVQAEQDASLTFAVSFLTFPGENAATVLQAVSSLDAQKSAAEPIIENRHDGRTRGIFFTTRDDVARLVTTLAGVEGIEWIERRQPHLIQNDSGVKIVQTGTVGTDPPLYRNGLTGAGQVYGAADTGLDADGAQFRLNGQASAQTLSYSVTTKSLVNGLLPVNITNPSNKVMAYYLLGIGNLISNTANPNGGLTLDPDQKIGARYLNAVGYDDSNAGYHGTATTSVAVGRDYNADSTGAVPGIATRTSGDGVAPDAKVVFQDVGHPSGQLSGVDLVSQALIHQQAYSSGVRAHNNSYGPAPPVSYDEDAADIDDAMWRLRDYNIFFAAGNSSPGIMKVTNAAKDHVVVAATESPTNGGSVENLAYYSNHGPTIDGRIKPDISAPGLVRAATENSGISSSYGGATSRTALDAAVNPTAPNITRSLAMTVGTSFASPMVAGSALLVRQYFVDGYYPNGARLAANGFNPSNALVKAIILNSGRNMTGRYTASDGTNGASGPLPNYGQGWGRIALDDSLYFSGDQRKLRVLADIFNGVTGADTTRPGAKAAITTGETHSYQIANVSANEPLRITLVWSDPKAAIGASVALVNNLDLEVVDPNGNIYRGNTNFANGYSQPANGAAFDNRNPVEAVYIQSPSPGAYTVRVIGANVPGNGQTQVLAQPGNQLIDSNRQGYALIATGSVDTVPAGASTSVDAASYVRLAAPGQIMSAFGSGFPSSTSVNISAGSMPLPTQLGGVSVRVNGILAPLYFAGVGGRFGAGGFQVNYQLPYETATSTAYVEVLNNGTPVAAEKLSINSASPGVFTVAANGQGQAIALNYDYSRNGDSTKMAGARTATRGRFIIVYANGQGGQFVDSSTRRSLTIATGAAAPGSPLYATASVPTVTIGGVPATVSFSGLAPGYVGLWQLNIMVPSNAPIGSAVPLVITFGGRSSVATTIAVN